VSKAQLVLLFASSSRFQILVGVQNRDQTPNVHFPDPQSQAKKIKSQVRSNNYLT
jgi:hypothetical protein